MTPATTGTGVVEMSQPLLEEKAGLMTLRANATAILLEASALDNYSNKLTTWKSKI